MILKVNNKKVDFFNDFVVELQYNSVASTFSFFHRFDPNNALHKEICKPFSGYPVTVEWNNQRLITGKLFGPTGFKRKADGDQQPSLYGYSKTGVLEDADIPPAAYPLQHDGLSLKSIAERLLKHFNLKLVVDPSVAKKCNETLIVSKANDGQKVKSYLCELAGQKDVIVTHDELGNLVFTSVKAGTKPVYHFEDAMDAYEINLDLAGQAMHSSIYVHKQHTRKHPNAAKATVTNPYSTGFCPRVDRQDSGNDVNTAFAARNLLREELREGISLTISLRGWELNGQLVRPNRVISVTSPLNYLYRKTDFFIERVTYYGNSQQQYAVLGCVVPEVYTAATPKNIFA